ncbi:MAG: hypothetical protein WCM93_05415 [Bacteroidota bacterium]
MKNMKTLSLSLLLFAGASFSSSAQQPTNDNPKPFTDVLMADSCTFLTRGRNTYFILEPGYQMSYAGVDGKDSVTLVVTVLKETKKIGNIETRVIEEKEAVNGIVTEISRNYFAFCKQTASVYYFGEDVDEFKNGKLDGHPGAWIAGEKNKPGVDMPGLVLLGSRYFTEIAPDVAMDRIEIMSIGETYKVPAGTYTNCLRTQETTPLEPGDKEYKVYAPGIGLLQDENAKLIQYGFVK